MTIATSNGLAFENEFQHSAGIPLRLPDTSDENEIQPEDVMQNRLYPPQVIQASDTVNSPMNDVQPYGMNPMNDTENGVYGIGGGQSKFSRVNTDQLGEQQRQELLRRTSRQPSNISDTPVARDERFDQVPFPEPGPTPGVNWRDIHGNEHYPVTRQEGHPLSPDEAASRYMALQNSGNLREAIGFAHEYEDRATDEQYDRYLHIMDDYRGNLEDEGSHYSVSSTQPFNPLDQVSPTIRDKVEQAMQGDKIQLIKQGQSTSGVPRHFFNFANKNGVGELNLKELDGGKRLYVTWMGKIDKYGEGGSYIAGPGNFGTVEIRDLLKQLKDKFPDAETIGGFRVSGARTTTGGGPAEADMRLRPAKPQPQRKSPQQLLQDLDDQ